MLLRMQSCMIIAFKKSFPLWLSWQAFTACDPTGVKPGGQVDGLGLGTANHRIFMLTTAYTTVKSQDICMYSIV